MVNLLTGPKGSGKTQQMIELANAQAKEVNGNVVFIKKTHRDTASVSFDIRTICMDDFPAITNIDGYIGFLYGMYSCNHDIADVGITAASTAKHTNAHQLFCAGIIGDFHQCLLLNH